MEFGEKLDKIIIDFSKFYIVLLNSYYYLINSLQILAKHEICHYDIKLNNIMYNSNKDVPIIIDFGLSFIMKQIGSFNDIQKLKSIFYTYSPNYYIWSPEIHLICFI